MPETYQSVSHSKWDCKYHVVFVPKRRRKAIFGQMRRQLGAIFHALARQKECQIIEGHVMADHVHMCIAIPPKHPVASVIGFMKERHCDRPAVWKGAKLLGRAFLGPGLRGGLRGIDRGVRTGAGPYIHPRAGSGGWNKRAILIY
jgi:putative transposase